MCTNVHHIASMIGSFQRKDFMARERRHRLAIDIPDNLHHILKVLAAKRNITITKYVIAAIITRLKLEGQYNNEEKNS